MTSSRETQVLVTPSAGRQFSILVEPEGMEYTFPPHEKILLTFRGPDRLQQFEISHHRDALTIWRPGDTEVWVSLVDGTHEQIGGFADNPAPWIDTGNDAPGPPPWAWPPSR